MAVTPLPGVRGWYYFGTSPEPELSLRMDPVDCQVEVLHTLNLSSLNLRYHWSGDKGEWEGSEAVLRVGRVAGAERGNAWIHLDGDKVSYSDGRSIPLQENQSRLLQLGAIQYSYRPDGQLGEVATPHGHWRISDDQGTTVLEGPDGIWTCRKTSANTQLTDPSGSWVLNQEGEDLLLEGPENFRSRLLRKGGRIVGWKDPRGETTRLERNEQGQVTEVKDPTGITWGITWEEGKLRRLERGDGARWSVGEQLQDPVGRTYPTGEGWPRQVRDWVLDWDRGYLRKLVDGAGRQLQLLRDQNQRITEIRWGDAPAWRLQRDAGGRLQTLTDPSGVQWRISWENGRLTKINQPDNRDLDFAWDPAGRLVELRVNGRSYGFQRDSHGFLVALRSPDGLQQRLHRDALGRWLWLNQADESTLELRTDEAGDPIQLGPLRLRRDAAGRPMQLLAPEGSVDWYRDGAGMLAGVTAPGIQLHLRRDPDGLLSSFQIGSQPVRIQRDAAGNLLQAGDWALNRDGAGQIIALRRPDGSSLRIDRDGRGRIIHLQDGELSWSLRRDAAGRVMQIPGPGVSLGIDRDSAGRPSLLRFKGLGFVRLGWEPDRTTLTGEGVDGTLLRLNGWKQDMYGRLSSIAEHALHYDPSGWLVAVEENEEGWSADPGGISGPGNSRMNLDPSGRPVGGSLPRGGWGLKGNLQYQVGPAGRVENILDKSGKISLQYDELGRLERWNGPEGDYLVQRDPFGRIWRVGKQKLEGWEQLLEWREPVADLPGVAWATASGGAVLAPNGTPIPGLFAAPLLLDPNGRLVGPGGVRLGLNQSLDPISGSPLGPSVHFPWLSPTLRMEDHPDSPIPSPDAPGTASWWNPAPWESRSDWQDPLQLLVELGELPSFPGISTRSSGLPWLPEEVRPPAPFRGSAIPVIEEDQITTFIIHKSTGEPMRPGDIANWVLGPLWEEWPTLPGQPPLLSL